MNDPGTESHDSISISQLDRVLPVCDHFEDAWRKGDHPQIDTYLNNVCEPDRGALLELLLPLEIALRLENGEQPTRNEYYARFADQATLVDAAFDDETELRPRSPSGIPTEFAKTAKNLLLGFLAQQNGFVDSQGIINAIHAWLDDKAQSFEQLLVSRGVLKTDQLAALNIVVEQHLKKHDGDIEKSLAALGSGEAMRQELRQIDDADIQTGISLVEMNNSTESNGETTSTYIGEPRGISSLKTRYHRLSFHKQGGLGVVYKAFDVEVRRIVALKEIKPRYADNPQFRARFLQEGEITGRLEHPGIVPVYGLGKHPDGKPYYAMRFIEGDSLKQVIGRFHAALDGTPNLAKPVPTLRELIGSLIAVCHAVEYGHSKGVIHRDLKPSNIMVGKYGETLVVDWGVAKVVGRPELEEGPDQGVFRHSSGSDIQPTKTNTTPGTPEYMSPEQAAGRIDLMAAASDIYSLGATLYHILTDQPPVTGEDKSELKARVRRGEFKAPRERKPETPAALEAVCLKAMNLDISKRYNTARDFADDLDRWLADEPVRARREPIVERTARWVRAHRPVVVGTAVLLVSAIVGLAISNLLLTREKAKTELARREAEERYITSRMTIREMLDRLAQRDLAQIPRIEELRLEVAQRALNIHRRFQIQRPLDPTLLRDTAAMHHEVANILRMMGRYVASFTEYKEAIRLFAWLEKADPGRLEDSRLRNGIMIDYGEALRMGGQPEEALKNDSEALALAKATLTAEPHQPGNKLIVARVQTNLAGIHIENKDFEPALALLNESIRLYSNLLENDGANRGITRLLMAIALRSKGEALAKLDRTREAEEAFQTAMDNLKSIPKGTVPKNDPDYQMAAIKTERGKLLGAIPGRRSEALEDHKQSIADLTQLTTDFPSIPFYRIELAVAYTNRCEILNLDSEKRDQAVADAVKARDLLEPIYKVNPVNLDVAITLARCVRDLSGLARDRGESERANELDRYADRIEKSLPAKQRRKTAVPSRAGASQGAARKTANPGD